MKLIKRIAIYDLDNTLINTEKLKELRDKREWEMVYNSFDKTVLDENIRKYIDKLNKEIFIQFIIVTSGPKNYAEKLLKYHNFLEGAKIIGYHDVKKIKPSSEPYLKALETIGEYDEVYIFGDDKKDFIAAEKLKNVLVNKKVLKVGCSWYDKCNYLDLDRELTLGDTLKANMENTIKKSEISEKKQIDTAEKYEEEKQVNADEISEILRRELSILYCTLNENGLKLWNNTIIKVEKYIKSGNNFRGFMLLVDVFGFDMVVEVISPCLGLNTALIKNIPLMNMLIRNNPGLLSNKQWYHRDMILETAEERKRLIEACDGKTISDLADYYL